MSAERAEDLERVAEAVSDGTPVDWKEEMAARPELSSTLLGLKRLEKVRAAHEGSPEPAGSSPGGSSDSERATKTWHAATTRSVSAAERPGSQPIFRWGPLDVLEKVGEGSGGEVFRAYDPSLETEFALKLRKTDDALGSATVTEFLAEGRRLARVRHPNVLVVHGADVHTGRMGIWTDLVRGKSLEAYLKQHGPLSAREATLIGLDLCRALAAVHAAGLVHRDVKTSNVMREEGGRIVLMDFGSMTELLPPGERRADAGPQGTPLTMAPEQLRGETAERAADLYALGVLLYRMVSARYPIEAKTVPELREKHARGDRVPLRDRRADLPLDFVQVVDRALAPDPRQRYSSAGEMERALAATLGAGSGHHHAAGAEGARRRSRRRTYAVAAVAATLLVVTLVISSRKPTPPTPRGGAKQSATAPAIGGSAPMVPAALDVTAALYRRSGERDQPLPAGGRVELGDQLSIVLQSNDSMYTYVFNKDVAGKAYVLFPISGVSPGNPLSAGVRYRLPGQIGDSVAYWAVTNVGGRESIVAIAARAPLAEVEQLIAQVPPASADRPVQRGTESSRPRNLRGIGGLVTGGTVSEETRRRLDETIRVLAERAKAKGDVWVWETEFENPAP
jgi:hypothetical protein